jgi:hypothetical protein
MLYELSHGIDVFLTHNLPTSLGYFLPQKSSNNIFRLKTELKYFISNEWSLYCCQTIQTYVRDIPRKLRISWDTHNERTVLLVIQEFQRPIVEGGKGGVRIKQSFHVSHVKINYFTF